jgi:hypothetical protein
MDPANSIELTPPNNTCMRIGGFVQVNTSGGGFAPELLQ